MGIITGGSGCCHDNLPNGLHLEPDVQQFLVVENESSVKHKRRFLHHLVDPVIVECSELVPLSAHHHSIGSGYRLIGVCCYGDQLVVVVGGWHDGGIGEIQLDLLVSDLVRV